MKTLSSTEQHILVLRMGIELPRESVGGAIRVPQQLVGVVKLGGRVVQCNGIVLGPWHGSKCGTRLPAALFGCCVQVEALTGGVVQLIKDLNGNHVVQRCLQVCKC